MKAIERILFKLALIQLFALIIVQGFILSLDSTVFLNRLYIYEGTAGEVEQQKLDVFESNP